MGLLESILGAVTGKPDDSAAAGQSPLGGALTGALAMLLAQNGGLPGLMKKFSQSGLGDIFASWTGMDENKPISANQVHQALGSEQLSGLASSMGIDPSQASGFLAEYLPKIVDKLTPTGEVDPNADDAQGLEALMPSLLASLGGGDSSGA